MATEFHSLFENLAISSRKFYEFIEVMDSRKNIIPGKKSKSPYFGILCLFAVILGLTFVVHPILCATLYTAVYAGFPYVVMSAAGVTTLGGVAGLRTYYLSKDSAQFARMAEQLERRGSIVRRVIGLRKDSDDLRLQADQFGQKLGQLLNLFDGDEFPAELEQDPSLYELCSRVVGSAYKTFITLDAAVLYIGMGRPVPPSVGGIDITPASSFADRVLANVGMNLSRTSSLASVADSQLFMRFSRTTSLNSGFV